ncbi:hypothetical protein COLO4_07775 [Corchorus olitorius]|uniref:Uncharacterized protein n=1 Tax=Corchorus olitorius TaxID=93759 RepID=A0A1R3KJ06_9ROSI|nr:hypothetical protein COLO4_07775 [Corchorus olitorius]
MDADPNSVTRPVRLMGTAQQIAKAEQLINYVLAELSADMQKEGILNSKLQNVKMVDCITERADSG